MDITLSPTCCKCREDIESSLLVFAEGPAIAWHCKVICGELFLQQPLNWAVKQVLRFTTEPSIKCLLDQSDGED